MPVYTWSDPRNLFSEEFTRCTRAHKHILHVYTHQCTWDTRETGFVWLSEPSVGCGSSFNALPSGPEWFRPIFLFSGVAFAFRVIPRISVAFKLMFLRRNLNSRTVSTVSSIGRETIEEEMNCEDCECSWMIWVYGNFSNYLFSNVYYYLWKLCNVCFVISWKKKRRGSQRNMCACTHVIMLINKWRLLVGSNGGLIS